MTSQQILQADLLDILFEKRNKLYGAYHLRRTYNRQLIKAVVIAVGSALFLLLFFNPSNSKAAVANEEGKIVVIDNVVPPAKKKKPELPKPPASPRTEPVKQQIFTNKIEITDKNILHPLPPQDAFEHAAVSGNTTDGKDASILQTPTVPEGKQNSNGGGTIERESLKEIAPDKQPQFPGGMQAWLAFLNRNLQSPEELESGEKRTVIIRFHVAEDGSITNFQIEKSAGDAFDNEVIRVLKKMPKWTPALQAGRPVSVSFTQPVTFVGAEN